MNEPGAATTSSAALGTGGGGRSDGSPSGGEEPVRWAGVDWSWSEHAVCVIDDAGAVIERLTEGRLDLPDPSGPVRIPDRRVIAQARVAFEVRLDNARPDGTGAC